MGAGALALGGVCCVVLLVAIAGGLGALFASWRGALELGGLVLAVVAAVTLLRARRVRGRSSERSASREPARQRSRRTRLVLVGSLLAVVVVGVAVLALAQRTPDSQGVETEPERAQAVPGQSGEGQRLAPSFLVETVDGASFSLAEQRGKVVVFDFLQAGCPSCAEQVPALDEAARRFASRGVKVLILDISGLDVKALRDYYRGELGASERLLIARDIGFRAARDYEVTAVTMTFVVGRDGRIRWDGMWQGDKEGLFAAIEEAASS